MRRAWVVVGLVALVGGRGWGAAERLSGGVLPVRYAITLAPDLEKGRFAGSETIEVTLRAPTKVVKLHAVELVIGKAVITAGGRTREARVAYDAANQMASLTTDGAVPAGPAKIAITWTAALSGKLRGFYAAESEGRKYAFTQFEAADARRAFPCFDEPAMKARFAVTAMIDPAHSAVSNGAVLDEHVEEGKKIVRFAETPPMSTYLVALAVGKLAVVEKTPRGRVPIRVVTTQGKERLAGLALDAAAELLARLEDYFGIPYPYGKLDLVAVPDFAFGAMENAGAIFFRESELLLDPKTASIDQRRHVPVVIAHEMAHQWFGDLVTMAWWDDLWLNEAFATWMETRIIDSWQPQLGTWVDFEEWRADAMRADSLAATHPIRTPVASPDEADANFDAVTYAKGATVLRMLETYLGEEPFRRGVSKYLQEHAQGNATAGDLWRALGEASGQPVGEVAASWIDQAGYPVVSATAACKEGRTELALEQRRFFSTPGASSKQTWLIPLCARSDGGTKCALMRGEHERLDLPGCGSWVLVNARHGGFYRVRYQAGALAALGRAAPGKLDKTERIGLLGDSWALARQGGAPLEEWLGLVEALRGDRSNNVEEAMVSGLEFLDDHLVGEGERAGFARLIEGQFRPLAKELGWGARAGEPEAERLLRRTVLGALGELGGAADVIAEAARRLKLYFVDPASLDRDVAGVVVGVGARRGDRAVQEALLARMRGDSSPQERQRLMHGLAMLEDPALVQRTLALSLGPDVRSQDMGSLLGQMLEDRRTRAATWAFVKEHFEEIRKRAPDTQLEIVVAATGAFCDEGGRKDVAEFLGAKERRIEVAERTRLQALESIEQCVAMKRREGAKLSAWLGRGRH